MSTYLWILSGTALAGSAILLWGQHEYFKQKNIGEQLDKECEELEESLAQQLKRQQVREETNTYLREQGYKPTITIKKTENINVVNEKPRKQFTSSSVAAPKRSDYSVGNKVQQPKPVSRRDDDYTYGGSLWGGSDHTPSSSNNSNNSCGHTSSHNDHTPSHDCNSYD